jgi:hypothetical protein
MFRLDRSNPQQEPQLPGRNQHEYDSLTLGGNPVITTYFPQLKYFRHAVTTAAFRDESAFLAALPQGAAERALVCLSALEGAFGYANLHSQGVLHDLPLDNPVTRELRRLVESSTEKDFGAHVTKAALGLIQLDPHGTCPIDKEGCWAGFAALYMLPKTQDPTVLQALRCDIKAIAESTIFNVPLLVAAYSTAVKYGDELPPRLVSTLKNNVKGMEAWVAQGVGNEKSRNISGGFTQLDALNKQILSLHS